MAAPYIAKDIRTYLVGAPLSLTNVYIGALVSTTVNQYAIVEYAGGSALKVHGSTGTTASVALDEGYIQIQARHTTRETALTNIMAIVDALDGLMNVTVNSVVYTYIEMISRPRILDILEDGSVIYIAEFRTQSRR